MKKQQALQRWHNLKPNQLILPHFTALAADAQGSTYGANRIRITGNPQFVDAVLSRLKDLLVLEAGATRLDFSISSIKPVFDKKWKNAAEGAEVCYIGVRERTALTRQKRNSERTAPLEGLQGTSSSPDVSAPYAPNPNTPTQAHITNPSNPSNHSNPSSRSNPSNPSNPSSRSSRSVPSNHSISSAPSSTPAIHLDFTPSSPSPFAPQPSSALSNPRKAPPPRKGTALEDSTLRLPGLEC